MNQKGFIQIPLLIATIFAMISAALVGTSVVLYEGGSASLLTSISESLTKSKSIELNKNEEGNSEILETEKTGDPFFITRTITNLTAPISNLIYQTLYEKKFEAEQLKQELELSKFREEKSEEKAEEELAKRVEAEEEKEEAEARAQREAIKRSQEEMARKAKEQELATKEAQEKMMNADNDGDGLTYREELKLGTSDWNTDSDGDGIPDNLDLHPAGGGRYLAQNFEWEYKGTIWTWNHSIHEDWYEYYKNKPRSPHGVEYVTENDPFIKEIAKTLKETADRENYHLTSFIVSFVQGLPYVEDYYTTFDEYPKYPIETFVERNGDCEDTSYLFASLIQSTGIGTALVQFHNHMGVGINTVHSQSGYYYPIGNEWHYYYETTGGGWRVGDLPKDYLYEKAKITKISDGSVNYAYPQRIKPCTYDSNFSAYFDGSNFYTDSQCNNRIYCLSYKGYYVIPPKVDIYWDSSCSQIVTKGCYKSKNYPGKFYKSGSAWYYDSQCSQLYKSMSCIYPSSSGYECTSEYSYNSKKSYCDYLSSSRYSSGMAASCYEDLKKCRNDLEEYQRKKNEYNLCLDYKEY